MIELNVSRKLGDLFNFTTGFTLQEFSSFTDCIGTFKSSSLLTDEDGFKYYPYYEADFSFERKISVIGIPVGFKLLTGTPGKTSLQIETGIQPSFVISAKLKEEGHYERKGLYPDGMYYNVFYLLEDIPRLNYTNYNVSEETELKTKSFLLNGFVAAGISAPVSAKIDLYIKGYFTTSFQDITADESKNQQYVNLFGEKSEYKKTTLFGAGIVTGILLR